MKRNMTTSVLLLVLSSPLCLAQTSQPAEANDWKPSTLNIPGARYPCVSPDNRVTFRVTAPKAKSAQVSIGKRYDMTRGGGQTFDVVMNHLDMFAYVGGFSGCPGGNGPAFRIDSDYGGIFQDAKTVNQKLKLVWITCGNKDGLIRVSQGVHNYLKEKGVRHVWHVDGNAHDGTEWANNPYLFAQHIFK